MATADESDTTTGMETAATYESASLKSQSLPHEYASEALQFSITDSTVDGQAVGDVGAIHESRRMISLEETATWSTLRLECTVELDSETIETVFPPDEWDDVPGRLAIVRTCDTAIYRDRDIVASTPLEADEYSIPIELNRERYRGDVVLQPYLVRTESRSSGGTNCATRTGARLADGEQWTIRVDAPEDEGGLLEPLIESFSDYPTFPDETHLHYLDLSEPRNPQLFLNRDHPSIIEILRNEGATGGPPRLRDVVYGYIEHSVWTQLLLRTAQDTDPDTGETEYGWEEDVLDIFYDELYEGLDRSDAACRLANDADGVEDLNILVQKIERAVNDRVDLPYHVQTLIEEGIQNVD